MSNNALIGILVIASFIWMGFGCWMLGSGIFDANNWRKRLVVYLVYGPISVILDLVFDGLPSLIDKIYGAREKFRRFVSHL